jgi:hypothetical protein
MSAGISNYLDSSDRLLFAAQRFSVALDGNTRYRDLAINDLLAAVETHAPAAPRFAEDQATALAAGPDETLASALFDVQAAGLLASAGLSVKETEVQGDPGGFAQALQEVSEARTILAQPPQPRLFTAPSGIASADLAVAKATFRTNSNTALKGIVNDAAETIGEIIEKLMKLDPNKITEAFGTFGQRPLEVLAAAGRLVRRALEKLKSAVEAIISVFGNEALAQVKSKVGEIWDSFKAGNFTNAILAAMAGTAAVDAHINEIIVRPGLDKDKIDNASNALAPLAEQYTSKINLLRALRNGIALALLSWSGSISLDPGSISRRR